MNTKSPLRRDRERGGAVHDQRQASINALPQSTLHPTGPRDFRRRVFRSALAGKPRETRFSP
jgi:hypothetical protein